MKTGLIALLLCESFLFAQWQPDVRLTNASGGSYTSLNNQSCIASSGDILHIVWYDDREDYGEIYYKRSTDAGINWSSDTRLTFNTSFSKYPSLSVSGLNVHIVWSDDVDGNTEIYYKRSTDGGISWGSNIRLTNNNSPSLFPSIAISGSLLHVVWHDYRDGSFEVYYKRSTDNGNSWSADTRLTDLLYFSLASSISVYDSNINIVWQDDRDGNLEIYYKRSTNLGVTWGSDTRLTMNSSNSWNPSISVSGQNVHVVWFDERDGNREIYYKRSTNGGLNWGNDVRITNNSELSEYPNIFSSVSNINIVWQDNRDGNYEIYYNLSTNGGSTWGVDTRLTNQTSTSYYPFVTTINSIVNVIWEDYRDANAEIYYKRNPTGNPNEIISIHTEIPNQFSLSQNYPNPFNPSTVISFQLVVNSFVSLKVYDLLGREVATLVKESASGGLKPGTYEVDFDGTNFPSGIYYYRLVVNTPRPDKSGHPSQEGIYTETKKMVLIK